MRYLERKMTFCAAHRLLLDKGPCNSIHGHNFTVTARLTGKIDPPSGMIVPISDMKAALQTIHDLFDHTVILNMEDPLVPILHKFGKVRAVPGEPTTEFLAHWIKTELDARFPRQHVSVHVQETDKNAAGAE